MPQARDGYGSNYQILVIVIKILPLLAEDENDFGIQI